MKKLQSLGKVTLFVATVALVGCGAAPPPKELVAARANYEKAEKGLAARLAPADLDNAKQALDRAEAAFEDEPEAPKTTHLAYIANRKATLAAVNGRIKKAELVKSDAESNYKEATEEELANARAELASGKQALETHVDR